jgi:hypothetical protein
MKRLMLTVGLCAVLAGLRHGTPTVYQDRRADRKPSPASPSIASSPAAIA